MDSAFAELKKIEITKKNEQDKLINIKKKKKKKKKK